MVDGVDVDVVSIGRSWIEQHDSLTQVRVDKLENRLKYRTRSCKLPCHKQASPVKASILDLQPRAFTGALAMEIT